MRTHGIYPHSLGDEILTSIPQPMLRDMPSFHAVIAQYDTEYGSILGHTNFGEDQVWQIITLLKTGSLYAGSNESVKNGRGSHTYGFTSGVTEGDIWGGGLQLHLAHVKKCHLYGLSMAAQSAFC